MRLPEESRTVPRIAPVADPAREREDGNDRDE